MTNQEKIIVSAYTGVLMCDFGDVHKYIEEKLGRPVYTHEMAQKALWDEIKEKSKDDFMAICKGEPHWIPCSKRLPDEETDVLVTRTFLGCKDGSHGWNAHIPPTTYVEVAQYFDGEWTALSDEYKVARSRHTNPIAWMPLPEPYKGE